MMNNNCSTRRRCRRGKYIPPATRSEGTGAKKKGSHSRWAIRVKKHLLFQVHIVDHPVGTGGAATGAETCAEGRRWHCTT
jgi:hypothetical protein